MKESELLFRINVKCKKDRINKDGCRIIYFKGIHFTEEYNCIMVDSIRDDNFPNGDLPGVYRFDLYNKWDEIYKLEISLNNGKEWTEIEKDNFFKEDD